MDKASLLGYAIKYMAYLQERVRTLEEQAANKAMESVMIVEKSEITDGCGEPILPAEIRARMCNNTILVKIQCGQRRGVIVKILDELEKLNLAIDNLSVATFGDIALDITIIAKVEKEFSDLSTTDMVTALSSALQALH